MGVFWQPSTASQLSAVQTSPSSQPTGTCWQPTIGTQRRWCRHPVVTVEGAPGGAGPALAGLVAVADVAVGTGCAVRYRRVLAARATGSQLSAVQTLASLQSSGVPAVQMPAWQVSSPLQTSPSAQDVPFVTGAFWQPETGIAAVRRADVGVVAVERRPSRAGAALAGLVAVADVAVGARTCRPPTGVFSQPKTGSQLSVVQTLESLQSRVVPAVQMPRLTGLVAVADVAVGAGRAVSHRRVLAARDRVAAVGRADVGVVAVERRAAVQMPALTGLVAVADVRRRRRTCRPAPACSGSRGPGRSCRSCRRWSRCSRGRPGRADAALTGLVAVADVAVRTGRAVRHRRVLAARDRVAAVRRADVAVVAADRRILTAETASQLSAVQASESSQLIATSGSRERSRSCRPYTGSRRCS